MTRRILPVLHSSLLLCRHWWAAMAGFAPGDRVRLVGLEKVPELNGRVSRAPSLSRARSSPHAGQLVLLLWLFVSPWQRVDLAYNTFKLSSADLSACCQEGVVVARDGDRFQVCCPCCSQRNALKSLLPYPLSIFRVHSLKRSLHHVLQVRVRAGSYMSVYAYQHARTFTHTTHTHSF